MELCAWCGSTRWKVRRIKVPCPLCGVDVEAPICPLCAMKLVEELRAWLEELRRG